MRSFLKRHVKRALRRYGYEIAVTRIARGRDDDFAPTFMPYRAVVPAAPAGAPRILHVIGNFYTGGSPRLVVDLVERLGDRFAQAVIARDCPSPPAYVGLEVEAKLWFSTPDEALEALSAARPDLVHVHYLGPEFSSIGLGDWQWCRNLFRALERLGKPVIENINIPIAPYVSDAVACYVFVSDYVRERFGYPQFQSTTIYPGSDVATFDRDHTASVPDDCAGMVYRLEGDKLNDHSIDVFIRLVEQRPEARVLIVGGGPLLPRYRAAVAEAGVEHAVTFTRYVAYDELRSYLQRMAVFVAPVHTESFGHVVPLAMSMGLPVAAYAAGALPEILADSSVLAPPGDADALAGIVRGLLDDRERRIELGAENRRRAVERFSVETMAERYADLYEELLRR